MRGTIVNLGEHTQIGRVIAFNEAFEDHSELQGRGRARRKKRKLSKIADKQEVQQARISKRKAGQGARQEKKTDKQYAKSGRKIIRKDTRNYGGDVPSPVDESSTNDQSEVLTDESRYNSPEGYENTGVGNSESENPESSYTRPQEEYVPPSGQDWDVPPQMEEEQSQGPEGELNEEEEEEDFDSSFDGVMGAEDFYSELTDENKKAIEVTPEIESVATKIEWHKENIARKRAERARLMGEGRYSGHVEEEIRESMQRIHDLENILHKYANFAGEFTGTTDSSFVDFLNASGPAIKPKQKKKRMHEIGKAQNIAKGKRAAFHAKMNKKKGKGNDGYGGDTTPVDIELNPNIGPQQIIVPELDGSELDESESNASGTGLNGLDNINDYDAPPTRTIEITSNASGSETVGLSLSGFIVTLMVVGALGFAIWDTKS